MILWIFAIAENRNLEKRCKKTITDISKRTVYTQKKIKKKSNLTFLNSVNNKDSNKEKNEKKNTAINFAKK